MVDKLRQEGYLKNHHRGWSFLHQSTPHGEENWNFFKAWPTLARGMGPRLLCQV